MKKSQGLPINTIILIILGAIVLVVLIWVYQTQIKKGTARYTEIGKEAQINITKCTNIILGRACANECRNETRQVYSPTGTWDDCAGKVCCETTSI